MHRAQDASIAGTFTFIGCLMFLACPDRAPSAASERTNRDASRTDHIKNTAVSSDVSIRIVPSAVTEMGGRTITLFDSAQHFHVVVTNVSKKPHEVAVLCGCTLPAG